MQINSQSLGGLGAQFKLLQYIGPGWPPDPTIQKNKQIIVSLNWTILKNWQQKWPGDKIIILVYSNLHSGDNAMIGEFIQPKIVNS